jgi:hypothetical protein
MGGTMSPSFWSDEDRWFVPRTFGLGYSLNLKYVAKRLGWIKSPQPPEATGPNRSEHADSERPSSREDRLRERIEASKYEDD